MAPVIKFKEGDLVRLKRSMLYNSRYIDVPLFVIKAWNQGTKPPHMTGLCLILAPDGEQLRVFADDLVPMGHGER